MIRDSPALIVADGARSPTASCTQGASASRRCCTRRDCDAATVWRWYCRTAREFFEITWGCQLSGLYYSAVNTHFTPDEVAYVIGDSDAQGGVHRCVDGRAGERILEANHGVDVHVVVGGALPGWQSYDDALGRSR